MIAIDSVCSVNNNIKNLSFGENKENKTSNINYKKYLTTPNIILGALATIGVLGMTDILLCKGRHINNLNSKKLTNSINNHELEEIIIKKDNRIQECEEQISSLLKKNNQKTKKIKSQDDTINNLEDKLEDKAEEITRLKKEAASLKADCEELRLSLKYSEIEKKN